jgi:hypothetical protein
MMGAMKDLVIQMNLPFDEDEMNTRIFELYTKSPNREFQSHVRFINADSIEAAEDKVAEVNPDYWKTQSVRHVKVEYIWKTFESLHFSYHVCKRILGLDKLEEDLL